MAFRMIPFLVLKEVMWTLVRRLVLRRKRVESWNLQLECTVGAIRAALSAMVSERDVWIYEHGDDQEKQQLVQKRVGFESTMDSMTASSKPFPGCLVTPDSIAGMKAEWYIPKQVADGIRVNCEQPGSQAVAWRKTDGKRRQVVLYMHGGAFVTGSVNQYRLIVSRLAATAGISVLGFEYRLMPKHRFGDILDDALTAYSHLRDACGLSPENIVLAGDSAGGHLAFVLALHLKKTKNEVPGALLTIAPWVDPVMASEASRMGFQKNRHVDILGTASHFLKLGSLAFSKEDQYGSLLSPALVSQLAEHLPRCLIQVGDKDCFHESIVEFQRLVNGSGGKLQLEVYKDQVHGFNGIGDVSPAAQESYDSMSKFLHTFMQL
mmetsp:Transcript_37909/g.107108  ORF Transcript_37909/g.107108 Transcript_37909/m.107108 type:complete len:378 (+) Transcript_37909:226-1359(+)